jgi:hypothetical protein
MNYIPSVHFLGEEIMRYASHPNIAAQPGVAPHSSFNRLVSVGAGGAMVGASLAGPVGAVIGGLVGLAFAESVNRAEREQVGAGASAPR